MTSGGRIISLVEGGWNRCEAQDREDGRGARPGRRLKIQKARSPLPQRLRKYRKNGKREVPVRRAGTHSVKFRDFFELPGRSSHRF
jgi:hypothetical protein